MTEPVAGVSRRRVVQGMAWAAPAVVIATAVPARAASAPETLTMADGGSTSRTGSAATAGVILAYTGDDAMVVTLRVSYPPGAVDAVAPTGVVGGWSLVNSSASERYWEYQGTLAVDASPVIFQATKSVTTGDAFDITFAVTSVEGGDPDPVPVPPDVIVSVPAVTDGNVGDVLLITHVAAFTTGANSVGFNGGYEYIPSNAWNTGQEVEAQDYPAQTHWLAELYSGDGAAGPWTPMGLVRSGSIEIPPPDFPPQSIPNQDVSDVPPGWYQIRTTVTMDDIVVEDRVYRGLPVNFDSEPLEVTG